MSRQRNVLYLSLVVVLGLLLGAVYGRGAGR